MENPSLDDKKRSQRTEALLAVYHECNAHAREHAKQRNEMISIYLVLFAAYAGLMSSDVELTRAIEFGLLGVMLVIGFLFSEIIIDFRCWIIRYLSGARAIMAVIMHFEDASCDDILSKKLWEGMYLPNEMRNRPLFRMGNLIVLIFIIITASPVIFILDQVNKQSLLAIIILITFAYVFILTNELINSVKNADNEGASLIETEKADNGVGEEEKSIIPWMIDFGERRACTPIKETGESELHEQNETETTKSE